MMNAYLTAALSNIFICLAVAVGVYITKSAWCLWGLVFLLGTSSKNEDKKNKEENTEAEA